MLHQTLYRTVSHAALFAGTPPAPGGDFDGLLASETNGFWADFADDALTVKDTTTTSNAYSSTAQAFWKDRSFTSYTGSTTTGKVVRNASGYYLPASHNLVPVSNLFSLSNWTKTAATVTTGQTDADGGSTASLITESNTSTSALYPASFTTIPNVPYTVQIKVKKGNSTWVRLAFGTSGGSFTNGVQQWYNLDTVAVGTPATTGTATHVSSSITSVGSSFYLLTLTALQASTTGALIISTATADASTTRTTSGTYTVYQAQCNAGPSALPYAATTAHNLCIRSDDFSAGWTQTDITIGSNTADTAGPNRGTNPDKITEGTAGTALDRSTAFTVPASSTVTASCYFKTSTATWIRFTLADGSDTNGLRQWFNLSTGALGTLTAIGAGTATSSTITDVGNGWYRCTITGVCSTSTSLTISFSSASADASNTRVNSVVYYGWGAQAELASSAGKAVATAAAAVYEQYFALPTEWDGSAVAQGILIEEARTNLALYARDLSNSAWTKTNITAAFTATGVDNVSNTASTLTATAGNGTCLQSITSGSAARLFSAFVKRRTGTGTIEMTQDNGTTWTDVTSSVTSSWTRIAVPVATVTNPIVGFRIGTNGDAIDVDYCQSEAGAFGPTSPIATGSASVTRPIDNPFATLTLMPTASSLTLYVKYIMAGFLTTGGQTVVSIDDNTTNNYIRHRGANSGVNPDFQVLNASSQQASITFATATIGTTYKQAGASATNDIRAARDGSLGTADTSATIPTVQFLRLGNTAAATPMNGYIQEVMLLPRALSNAELQTLTT